MKRFIAALLLCPIFAMAQVITNPAVTGTAGGNVTGTGPIVLQSSPTLTTPNIGAATATSLTINSYSAGTWTTPAFAAGSFTASGSMTWTVGSGDVTTYEYTIINKLMTVNFNLVTTTVGGTLNNELRIAIPASKTSTSRVFFTCFIQDNATPLISICEVGAGATYISIYHDVAFGNFAAATDASQAKGSVTFQIN